MVKVEGVSQRWCDQFGTRVMYKLMSCYSNHPDLSLDNFMNERTVSKATGPVSYVMVYCTELFNDKVMVRMRKQIVNSLSVSVETSYQLFQREGMSLVRICVVAYIQVL